MSTEDKKKVITLQKELVVILLQKAGVKEKDIYKVALTNWVSQNLDLLTPIEREKYQNVIL